MDKVALAKTLGAGAIIFLLTLAVYLPVMSGEFLWDDDWLISENPRMKELDGVVKFWRGGDDPDYYPLTWTSLWIEHQIWKEKPIKLPGNVQINAYHISNIIQHAISAILVWLVLRCLGVPGAWLAGVIFAVHPVNVASAAWISERKNTLSMIFYLLTILTFLEFDSRGNWKWYGVSLGMFVLALLSKTSVVMTPLVLLGCLWWRRDRIARRDLLLTGPFFALAIIMSLIGIWFQTHIVIQNTVLHSAQEGFFWRLAVAGMAPWFYLYKALLPVDLAAIYPRWQVDAKSIVSFLPFLALVGVFLLFWRYRRGWGKPPLMAMGYVLVSLFPVLGFFDMYYQLFSLAADHWQYVAIVGTIALVTGLGWHLASGRTRPVQWAAGALAVAVVVTLSALTWRHAGVYRTKESLWGDNIAKYPQAWMAYFNLAGTLDKKGQPDEAVSLYQTCIKLNPRHEKAYINIGTILSRTEKFEEAAQYYAQAIRINPRSAMAHSNLGVMLHSVGRAQEALAELREAVRLDSRYFDAQSNLGTVLDTLGVEDQAIEHWKKALEVRDQNDVRLLLASLLAKQGKDREAVEQYCRIVSNDPNFTEGYFQLGLLRTRMGQLGQAKDDFLRVLQMKGDHVDAHNNLAILYLKAGQLDQAVRHFRLAIRSQPDHPNANYNLAFLLASNGLMRESLGYYYRAIQAKADWPEPRITLARVLASCTDDGVRNGPEALRLAEEACRLTRYSRADALDALAAAYAELGRFGDAAKAANKAVELARAAGQNDFAADIAARAQLYTASRPWRRPPPAVNPVVAAALAS